MATPQTPPTPQEAEEALARATDEIQRLTERFAQRPKEEKKRLGQLQQLVPKLKRLRNPAPAAKEFQLSNEDRKVLASLAPAAKS